MIKSKNSYVYIFYIQAYDKLSEIQNRKQSTTTTCLKSRKLKRFVKSL